MTTLSKIQESHPNAISIISFEPVCIYGVGVAIEEINGKFFILEYVDFSSYGGSIVIDRPGFCKPEGYNSIEEIEEYYSNKYSSIAQECGL